MEMNAISWFEIPVVDFDKAKAFYEAIFEASFFVMDAGNSGRKLAMFPVDMKNGVGGALVSGPGYKVAGDQMEGMKIYLNANGKLDRVLELVEKNGGKVVVPKMAISPEFGWMGAFLDTEGNWIGLHSI